MARKNLGKEVFDTLKQGFSEHPIMTTLILTVLTGVLFLPGGIILVIISAIVFADFISKDPPSPAPSVGEELQGETGQFMTHAAKKAYLESPEWGLLKRKIYKRDTVCLCCGSPRLLQVHHVTYKRLGKERLSDLILLCSQCHSTGHKYLGYTRKGNYPLSKIKESVSFARVGDTFDDEFDI